MTVSILTGDCRDLVPRLADESFDLILTDCPYGETSLTWDRWVSGWPALVRPKLKRTGSMWVFGSSRMRSVIYCRNEHGRAEHPTQKPIGIVEPLLLYACPPGGAVLDCFAGSGTTGIVAKRHGMSATLIEGDEVFVDVIHRRLLDDAPLLAGAA